MTGIFPLVCAWSLLFGLAPDPGCTAPGSAPATLPGPSAALSPTLQAAAAKDVCLECHGPFKELSERTAKYVAPSGETVSPHRYVPHDEKEKGEIPDCVNCHQKHPVPPSESDLAALPKPTVEWCYQKCHHTRDFTPCKTCHPSHAGH